MPNLDYLDFVLEILCDGDRYRSHVIDSPYGEATVYFNLPYKNQELEHVPDGTLRLSGPASEPGTASSLTVQKFGETLYAAVFAGEVGTCLQLSYQKAKHQKKGLRIQLRLDAQAPELGGLPWEYLYVSTWTRFLALSNDMPLVRYVEVMYPRSSILVKPPLHILVVASRPKDEVQLKVEQEWQRLQEGTASMQDQVVIERLPQATFSGLDDRMSQGGVHLLHFIGHGYFDERTGRGGLIFEDEAGNSDLIDAPRLAEQLRDKGLRLIFLNACEGARSGSTDPFSGVAQILVQTGIPVVIAMQFPVSEQTAITLSSTFYEALAQNYPVDTALTEARRKIRMRDELSEWATPVLFSRQSDNRLFDPSAVASTKLPDVASPYRGLQVFEEAHASDYFGRDHMLTKLLGKLAETNFVALAGPSGSGKSSLLHAGLVPALKENRVLPGSATWKVENFRPGEDPLVSLLAGLIGTLDPTLARIDYPAHARRLASQLCQNEVRIDDLLDTVQPPARLLLIVDPFEEALLAADETTRAQFLAALLAIAQRPWAAVLIAFRADAFGIVLDQGELSKRVVAGLVSMLPMDREEQSAAIERPAVKAGRRFEDGLVNHILAAAAQEPGQLTLLEFALTRLWDRQTPEGLLTHTAFKEIGEVEGAIANYAEEMYATFQPHEQEKVRAVFTKLVRIAQPDEGIQAGKRRIYLSELDKAIWPLVQRLVDKRLLVTNWDDRTRTQTIEIAHEALIRRWNSLQKWVNEDGDFKLWQNQLERILHQWEERNDPDLLLRGRALVSAEDWLPKRSSDLSERERNFIQASIDQRERVRKEREAEQKRKQRLAFTQQQNAYQRQMLFGALGTAVGYGLALSYIYLSSTAGSLLLKPWPPDPWRVLFLLFLLGSQLGLIVGAAIGLSLWRWRTQERSSSRRQLSRKMAAVGTTGAIAGSISYLLFVLATYADRDLTVSFILSNALFGLILGGGLGLGIALGGRPGSRVATAIAFSMGAAALAFPVHGLFQREFFLTSIIAGALIGACSGLGFALVVIPDETSMEGDSYGLETT